MPAVPAPAPSVAPAPAPPQHVYHPAAPAPSHSATNHSRHHSPQPMEDQRAEPQLTETEPGPRPVLPQLDTETLQRPPMSCTPSAAPPSSDHLPFPMLTDDITPTQYALEWLAGHPDRPMQGEGLETVQVPSVRPISLNSPASSPRHHRLSSGGYTTDQPISVTFYSFYPSYFSELSPSFPLHFPYVSSLHLPKPSDCDSHPF